MHQLYWKGVVSLVQKTKDTKRSKKDMHCTILMGPFRFILRGIAYVKSESLGQN